MSGGFLGLGISMLCWSVLLFVQTIFVYLRKTEEKKRAIAKIVVSEFFFLNRFKDFRFYIAFFMLLPTVVYLGHAIVFIIGKK